MYPDTHTLGELVRALVAWCKPRPEPILSADQWEERRRMEQDKTTIDRLLRSVGHV